MCPAVIREQGLFARKQNQRRLPRLFACGFFLPRGKMKNAARPAANFGF
jgi:hypothetical protein